VPCAMVKPVLGFRTIGVVIQFPLRQMVRT
jgi:hypothetical protein